MKKWLFLRYFLPCHCLCRLNHKYHGVVLLVILVFLLSFCGVTPENSTHPSSSNNMDIVNPNDSTNSNCPLTLPPWVTETKNDSNDVVQASGISNWEDSPQKALLEAENDAKQKIIRARQSVVVTSIKNRLSSQKSDDNEVILNMFQDDLESFSAGTLHHMITLKQEVMECPDKGKYLAAILVQINQQDIVPSEKDIENLFQGKNRIQVTWNIMIAQESTKKLFTLADNGLIRNNDWMKLFFSVLEPTYLYILNYEKQSGDGFFYFPSDLHRAQSLVDSGKGYSIPLEPVDAWSRIQGDKGTQEVWELIGFSVESNDTYRAIQQKIQQLAGDRNYQVPKVTHQIKQKIDEILGNTQEVSIDWFRSDTKSIDLPSGYLPDGSPATFQYRQVMGTTFFCRDQITYSYE